MFRHCCSLLPSTDRLQFKKKKIKLNLLLISNKISTYSTSQFTRVCFTSTYLKLQTKTSPSERSLTGIWMLPLGVLQPVHLRWQSGALRPCSAHGLQAPRKPAGLPKLKGKFDISSVDILNTLTQVLRVPNA